jgi:transcriptional regulator with XRE-family HTH domain
MEKKSFTEQIREAIRQSGRTNYDIAKAMNIAPSTLWRFAQGQTGMSVEKLDKLAEALDLHVVVGHKRKDRNPGWRPGPRVSPSSAS